LAFCVAPECVGEVCPGQVRFHQAGVAQIDVRQIRIDQDTAAQICVSQIGVAQVPAAQICVPQIGFGQIRHGARVVRSPFRKRTPESSFFESGEILSVDLGIVCFICHGLGPC
jgi:hypothetical protein